MRPLRVLAFLALCLLACTAFANSFTYTITGAYPDVSPSNQHFYSTYSSSPYIVPGQTFTISFGISGQADSLNYFNPWEVMGYFNIPMNFLLNGQSVGTPTGTVEFWRDQNDGKSGIIASFVDPAVGVPFLYQAFWDGGQFWAGPANSPTFATGTFPGLGGGITTLNDILVLDGSVNPLQVEVVASSSPVPEPASMLLLGTGLTAGLGVLRRRARH